eukprot:Phypoly_transcript_17970.p1 GENE.Phypoly_transcript_17970~~Phypoly_transcript_17970.p1  ORF type:complete len:237 (+),score=52.78 Phypoly_transcript_17970:77-712(+)
MSQMNHPNILKFHGVCLDEGAVSLITEYMPYGNLKDKLAESGSLPLPMRIQIAIDIANGMKFLDSCHDNLALRKHDSLKSNNIMIGKDWEVKITDYGQTSIKDLARTMTSIGSIAWTAPEILAGEENTTPKIAVYSFGIILWELYTRQVPYLNEHPIRVVTKILTGYRPPIPADCPQKLHQLIADCLKNDPQDRPSWDAIKSSLTSILTQM